MILMMMMAGNLTMLSGWVGSKLKTALKPLVNWPSAILLLHTEDPQELGLVIDSQRCEAP